MRLPLFHLILISSLSVHSNVSSQELVDRCTEWTQYVKEHPYENSFKTKINGGYHLEFAFDCNDQYLLFKKGNQIIDTISSTSFGLPYQVLGFVFADYETSFVLAHKFGGGYPGNPVYFELIDKRTGQGQLPDGIALIDADENKGLLIYSEKDVPKKGDSFTVLDVERNRKRKYLFPNDVFGEAGVCNRMKIKVVNKRTLVMEYNIDGQSKAVKFRR